jgi:hypothetical protein
VTAVTEPTTPPYGAPRTALRGKPPISLPPVRAEGPQDDTARVLAITVVALSGLYTTLAVLSEVLSDRAALDQADGHGPDDATVGLDVALSLGSLILLLPLWIMTSLWLRAERRRMGRVGSFRHGTTGTFLSWVVPVANLVWPFRVVREVHHRAVEPRWRESLGWWWALWLLSLLLGRNADRLSLRQDVGDPAAAVLVSSAVYAVVLALALWAWVGVVQQTSRVRT